MNQAKNLQHSASIDMATAANDGVFLTSVKTTAKRGLKGAAVAVGALASGVASAAVDTAAVGTSLTAAQTSGEAVGALVIGVVAALVVVGIIINLVKKA